MTITSQPSNNKYRNGWDNIWKKKNDKKEDKIRQEREESGSGEGESVAPPETHEGAS